MTGFTANPMAGQAVVAPGTILLSETGDATTRPSWAKDGTFLVFRQLKQLVPEFNAFLTANPIVDGNLTAQQGSDLLGARMVGRWKSVSSTYGRVFSDSQSFHFLLPRVPPSISPRSWMTPHSVPTPLATTTSPSNTQTSLLPRTRPSAFQYHAWNRLEIYFNTQLPLLRPHP